MLQFLKNYWQYFVIGALALVTIGMGAALSGKAPAPAQVAVSAAAPAVGPAVAAQAPTTSAVGQPVCPAGYDCTPKPTEAEKIASAIDRLGGRLATPAQAAPATQPAATPPAAKSTQPRVATHVANSGAATGRDPAVRYSGGTCRLSTGSTGLDGWLISTGERRCFSF